MQNFGRGMWRRVGDYERIHVPIIHKNYELERYLALMEYNKRASEFEIYSVGGVVESKKRRRCGCNGVCVFGNI